MTKIEYTREEMHVARAIYRALKRQNSRALVTGAPAESCSTLIDGQFDLRRIARKVLMTRREDEEASLKNIQTRTG